MEFICIGPKNILATCGVFNLVRYVVEIIYKKK